jgi:hypothetical protein
VFIHDDQSGRNQPPGSKLLGLSCKQLQAAEHPPDGAVEQPLWTLERIAEVKIKIQHFDRILGLLSVAWCDLAKLSSLDPYNKRINLSGVSRIAIAIAESE